MEQWARVVKALFVIGFIAFTILSLITGNWLGAIGSILLCIGNLYDLTMNRPTIGAILVMFIGLMILLVNVMYHIKV